MNFFSLLCMLSAGLIAALVLTACGGNGLNAGEWATEIEIGQTPATTLAYSENNEGKSRGDNSDTLIPNISTIFPADGAVNVSLRQAIEVQFDEPITITHSIVTMHIDGSPVPLTVRHIGNRLTLFPVRLDQRARDVRVRIHGVRDRAGNEAEPFSWSWQYGPTIYE